MQLRGVTKRPERFEEDPTIYQAPKRAAHTYLPRTARPHTCIEFNPNLPAAAFPTLDVPRPVALSKPENLSTATSSNKSLSTDLEPLYQIIPTTAQRAAEVHCPDPHHCALYPSCAKDPLEGFDANSESNNGPDNPMFVKNWELARKLAMRTDEEWFEHEMMTSEEEDNDEMVGINSKAQSPPPQNFPQSKWKNLTLAVQLIIFASLSRVNPPPTVRSKLGLSKADYSDILQHRLMQQQQAVLEDRRITEVIDFQFTLLLQRPKLQGPEFSAMFDRYLQDPIKSAAEMNYSVKSSSELEHGRQFLKTRGLDTQMLEGWDNITETPPPPPPETITQTNNADPAPNNIHHSPAPSQPSSQSKEKYQTTDPTRLSKGSGKIRPETPQEKADTDVFKEKKEKPYPPPTFIENRQIIKEMVAAGLLPSIRIGLGPDPLMFMPTHLLKEMQAKETLAPPSLCTPLRKRAREIVETPPSPMRTRSRKKRTGVGLGGKLEGLG